MGIPSPLLFILVLKHNKKSVSVSGIFSSLISLLSKIVEFFINIISSLYNIHLKTNSCVLLSLINLATFYFHVLKYATTIFNQTSWENSYIPRESKFFYCIILISYVNMSHIWSNILIISIEYLSPNNKFY